MHIPIVTERERERKREREREFQWSFSGVSVSDVGLEKSELDEVWNLFVIQ